MFACLRAKLAQAAHRTPLRCGCRAVVVIVVVVIAVVAAGPVTAGSGLADGPFRVEALAAGSLRLELVSTPDGQRARVRYRAYRGEQSVDVYLDADPVNPLVVLDPALPPPPHNFVVTRAVVAPGRGCVFPVPGSPRPGSSECVIPDGVQPTGPVIHLGDGDDSAAVFFWRGGDVVVGGAGDDFISGGGRLIGGPGNDEIKVGVPAAKAFISGGPGDDLLGGGQRRDVIEPGPGNDDIYLGKGSAEKIDTRDGEIDYLECGKKDRADIDAIDAYPDGCAHVHRHGGPARVIPGSNALFGSDFRGGRAVSVECPADGPRLCVGTVRVSRGKCVFVRRSFRFRRYNAHRSDLEELDFHAGPRKQRAMNGELTVTVRSRDRAGNPRTASGTYGFTADR
jgi:hypothetical protein